MQRSRYFSLLLILLLIAGPALAIPAGTVVGDPNGNNGNVLGLDDNTYINQVIVPAKAANQGLNPEQRARYLEIMHRQAVVGQADPRRDRAGGPDDQGYEYRDSDENGGPAYDWVDIVGAGGAQSWNFGDDAGVWVDLGFNITWYGNEYNRLWICSNGWASFSEQATDYSGWRIPGGGRADALAVMFADWYMPDGGTAWFFTDGNQAVVTWDNISYWGEGNNTFQIVINSSGMVKYQYAAIGINPGFLIGFQNRARDRGFTISQNEDGYPTEGMAIGMGNRWIQFDGPGIAIRPAELAFGNVPLNNQRNIRATISNVGAQTLSLTGVECDEQAFILPQFDQQVDIESGASIQVDVGFAPPAAGDYAADIRISCNAENAENGIFVIRATGHGFAGPIIAVDPQSIDDELNTGDVNEYTVTISNDGGSALDFTVEQEIIREAGGRDGVNGPRRDNAGDLLGQFQGINVQNQYSSCV